VYLEIQYPSTVRTAARTITQIGKNPVTVGPEHRKPARIRSWELAAMVRHARALMEYTPNVQLSRALVNFMSAAHCLNHFTTVTPRSRASAHPFRVTRPCTVHTTQWDMTNDHENSPHKTRQKVLFAGVAGAVSRFDPRSRPVDPRSRPAVPGE
jgi:hypothetical protein